ncbi:MAG: lactonase family protein [Chthoniobacteraceae bacterium]|nr:lactonase family protein [Chthoniobacteraceae bacterium]
MLPILAPAATPLRFYLGTYTRPGGGAGIYTGILDPETGKLTAPTVAAQAPDPSFLALSPDGKFLYAALETKEGAVAAYRVEPGGATLAPLNETPAEGAATCHVAVDATGHSVLAANYNGGNFAVFPTQPGGSLAPRATLFAPCGSGPHPKRQAQPHAHCILTDPTGRFAYGCDLGSDRVWAWKLDTARGTLTPLDPPAGITPAGAGPRHAAFGAGSRFLYVCNELANTVTVFTRDTASGTLAPLQNIPTLPENLRADPAFATAEIACHPTGRWLYVSNRDTTGGGRDTVAVFAIADDGKLTFLEAAPAGVKVARGFALDPAGRWLLVAGQEDGRIAVMRIDPATGTLCATGQTAAVPAPVCVLFAPR